MTATPETTAVVLSGGGAKGAYEVGVLLALVAGASPSTGFQPLEAGIFTGTSVGSFNAGYLAQHGVASLAAATRGLEELWRDRIADGPGRCGNGVYRLRGAPLQLLDPGCLAHPLEEGIALARDALFFGRYAAVRSLAFALSPAHLPGRILATIDIAAFFSPEPLEHLLHENLDVARLAASPLRLTIASSNWESGNLSLWDSDALLRRVGLAGFLASASLPGIFPPVLADGALHVDGGLLLNTPIRPAVAMGADELHVVYVDPLVADIPLGRLPTTIEAFYRTYAILVANSINLDLAQAAGINQGLRAAVASRLLSRREVSHLPLDAPPSLAAVLRRAAEGRPYRQLVIHRYRPVDDLGGGEGLLDFRQDFVAGAIELGYRDAVAHDCEAQGCILS